MIEFQKLLVQPLLFLLDDVSVLLYLFTLNLLLHFLQLLEFVNNSILLAQDLDSLLMEGSLLSIQRRIRTISQLFLLRDVDVISFSRYIFIVDIFDL